MRHPGPVLYPYYLSKSGARFGALPKFSLARVVDGGRLPHWISGTREWRLEVGAAARFSGIESRRSTRIDRTVPLVVVGQTKLGLSFQERTSAGSLNLHGV